MRKKYLLSAFFCLFSIKSLFATDLYVGSNSSGNTTNFSSGEHPYRNTYIGFTTNASSNTLNVLDTATLTNAISPALYTSMATMAFNNAVAQYNEMIQRLGL